MWAESHSKAARRDRGRRQWLMEGSFADAANNHGVRRARWRRLWRERIQDFLIATAPIFSAWGVSATRRMVAIPAMPP